MWNYPTRESVLACGCDGGGNIFACGSFDSTLYVFNDEGKLLWRFSAGDYINKVHVSIDGTVIIGSSKDGTIYVFNKRGDLKVRISINFINILSL